MTTINMNTFQLPCSSTFDFMARMGVVYAAYNSFAEVGGVPKSPRSKVRELLNPHAFLAGITFQVKYEDCSHSNSPTYSALGSSNFYFWHSELPKIG